MKLSSAPNFKLTHYLLLVPVDIRSPDDCLGRDAIVQLVGDEGREMLRRVMPGTRARAYSLQAYSGAAVEAEIVGGRPVLARVCDMQIPTGG